MIKRLLKKLFGGKKAEAPKKEARQEHAHHAAAERKERSAQPHPRERQGGQREGRQGREGRIEESRESVARPEKRPEGGGRRRGGSRRGRGKDQRGGGPAVVGTFGAVGTGSSEEPRPQERKHGGAGEARQRRRPEEPREERKRDGERPRPERVRAERPREHRGEGPGDEGGERPVEPVALPELPPIPPWTPPDDPTSFTHYDLPPAVRAGIADAGFTACTPVQAKVLPLSLQGKDVAAQSQTGTGKTAAFLLTIFSRLLWRGPVAGPKPRALVIAPTRELAVQIESDARSLGAHTGLTATAVFGGVDYDKQRRILREGTDLVIGTPGRLIDYLKQGAWRPEGVEMLVIDEADRMFDMGFIRDLRFILKRLPHYDRRQSMLFSATMSWRVMELTYEYMNLPSEVRATPEKMTAERAEEELYHVSRDEKPALLLGIMAREKPERTMVFTNTKAEAEKVAKLLEHHGFRARGITGNLEQSRRLRLMEEFKAGDLPILVATDVASRGLHIEGVSHVVNWDLPQDPEDYVHRIGRTARAGAVGKAVSLADESGALNLEAIEKLIGYKIPVVWHESEHLGDVKPGWREAAARERREREREQEQRTGRHRTGEAPRSGDRGRRRSGGAGRGRSGGRR